MSNTIKSAPRTTTKDVALTFFADWLVSESEKGFTASQVIAGLLTDIYTNIGSLPGAGSLPAGDTSPNFAVIDDGSAFLKLAYWDFASGASGSWALTDRSTNYLFPFLVPGPVLALTPIYGAGNFTWQHQMGMETRVKAAARITELHLKLGTGAVANGHRWEILRSTSPGASAPALSTYTDVLATGLHTTTAADVWEAVGLTPIAVAANDWVVGWVYPGPTSGQNLTISTIAGSDLNEDYAELNGGIYRLNVSTGFPGPGSPVGVPTTRIATVLYGLANLEFGAP